RIIVSTTRDNPEQFLAVMLGDYVTPDFRKVLETKLIPEEVAWPDRSTDLIYRLTNPQKGQTSFLAILQQRFLAVASDRAILQKAYVRFQDRKRINGNDTLRKLLAGSKSDATIRMAASPQFLLGDKALEHFGILNLIGECQLADEMHYHFQMTVKEPQAFRQAKDQLTRSVAMSAFFDQRQLLLAMILANAHIDLRPGSREAQVIEMTGKLSQKE